MLQFMKNKILIPLLIAGCLAVFFSFNYTASGPRSSNDKRKLVIEMMLNAINVVHYSPRPIDDTFSARVFRKTINDLDYGKIFFTQQDMKKLKTYEFKIDDEIKDNSIEFFDTLDAIFMRRIESAEKFYGGLLDKPFSFKGNDEIQLVAAKLDYVTDDNDMIERWREQLKSRVIVKYVELKDEQDKKKENKDSVNVKWKTDDTLEAMARQSVRKSYQTFFKRYKTMKDDDLFRIFANNIAMTEDPHTEYFPPVEKKKFDEIMSGNFVGIGAKLSPANDKVTVTEIITGSASYRQRELKSGDEILKVAQGEKEPVDIAGFDLDDVVKLIRGPKGTEVRLTVKRPDGAVKVISIIRDIVEIEETFAKSAIINSADGPVGYIYLPEFYADFNHINGRSCSRDIAEEVKKLKISGVNGIILDLRGNGGGSLNDVVEMAGVFVGKGPVVQVKTNNASPNVLNAQKPSDSAYYNGPLAIMVDEGSASASEILAAAMQDYKRAVIVGGMTYGKGTVQKIIDLDQGVSPQMHKQMENDTLGAQGKSIGSLKLTMEKFYRINGGSTQLKGVTPDISLPDAFDSYDDEDFGERNNKSALAWDEIKKADYNPTNSVPDLKQLAAMSASRVKANETFKLITENSEYTKKKREDNKVSLNETKYRKYQAEANERSKKFDDLLKQSVKLDVTNNKMDLARINIDSSSINKNKEWLKNISQNIYIAETVNIINDMNKSAMKLERKTGMK